MGSLKKGQFFEEGCWNGPQISQLQVDRIDGMVKEAVKQGAKIACGGNKVDGPGYFYQNTIVTDVTDDMTIHKEEVFGPVQNVYKYKDLDDAIHRANDHQYGLAAGLVSQDITECMKGAEELLAGQVFINGWGNGNENSPFGGHRESGIGRELGDEGLSGYLETSSVLINHSV